MAWLLASTMLRVELSPVYRKETSQSIMLCTTWVLVVPLRLFSGSRAGPSKTLADLTKLFKKYKL
ncbi:hypothetical protein I7I51_05038 [Histoplasma capsulatum]|uniref:Uncharacterized protein n=1 Tax=Ajellomyces capsulatus TaxID=5037 RepID=A0A8A1M2L1_AJECA|nr:hypothetical protein I7I51_05038 [Histoplasma capsulatum]